MQYFCVHVFNDFKLYYNERSSIVAIVSKRQRLRVIRVLR